MKNDTQHTEEIVEQDIDIDTEIVDTEELVETDIEGNEVSVQAKIQQLRKKLKEVEKERNEYLDGWQRAKADTINKQKEFELKQKELITFANQKLLIDFIPVMDSFVIAMSNKTAWNNVDPNWRIGVEYIKSQLETVLTQNELCIYGAVGDQADPSKYDSIETIETEDETKNNTVAEILQYGYTLKGKIIREAKCKTFIIN
jgi:molecular chaperone GrpE